MKINTHCHVDHIQGNYFIARNFKLKLAGHKLEILVLEGSAEWGIQYGIRGDLSPVIEILLEEGDIIEFGNSFFEVIFFPGHSPGHIAFVNHDEKFIINGDVLFKWSFGRYDLPGGNPYVLSNSI